jgi:UDP-N-acetylglucosamine 2-epimerase
MYDAILWAIEQRQATTSSVLASLGLAHEQYVLATVHRASNTDDCHNLSSVMSALGASGEAIVFPVHPRTLKALEEAGIKPAPNIITVEPVSYLEMVALERSARRIVTDSGGVQKEAFWLGVPCITVRDETEWVETVESGWNTLTSTVPERILAALSLPRPEGMPPQFYGDGHAAEAIAEILHG